MAEIEPQDTACGPLSSGPSGTPHAALWLAKEQARRKLSYAIASGLKRPAACVRCGVQCIVQGHHTDYGRPLQVVWLCRRCHRLAHSKAGSSAAETPPAPAYQTPLQSRSLQPSHRASRNERPATPNTPSLEAKQLSLWP